jgi:citrate synthase
MGDTGANGKNSLSIRDNRTGREYQVDILDGDVIRAMDLRQIKVNESDFGMMAYDPAFTNTASTRSTVTFIDGEKGILRYRGYPIEQLAERSSHLEVSYLLLKGELPTQTQLDEFVHDVTFHTYVHENITELVGAFRYDAHAMGMVTSMVAALSTFYPDAKDVDNPRSRWIQIIRLIAKLPTLAGYAYRHHRGLPLVYPENELSYTANFLSMLFKIGTKEYKPSPCSSGRSTCSSSCMPTTSRTARPPPCVSSAPRGPIRSSRSPEPWARSTARSTAVRTRRCCACSTASGASTTSPPSWTG